MCVGAYVCVSMYENELERTEEREGESERERKEKATCLNNMKQNETIRSTKSNQRNKNTNQTK